MKKTLFAGTLLALALYAAPVLAQHEHGADDAKAAAIEKPDAVVHVSGLMCGMCVKSLSKQLKKIESIDQVQVLMEEDQRALLTLKKEQQVTEKELKDAVEKAGFKTVKVEFAAGEKS